MREIVDRAYTAATEILTRRRHLLEQSARRLLEKGTLTEDDLASLRGTAAAA